MRVLLVDATNIFLRSYSVIPTMNRNGEPNGGVYGFLNSLGYYNRIIEPDKIILCWDGAHGSKRRRALVENYKQGRKPTKLSRNFDHETVNEGQNKLEQRLRLNDYLNDLPVTQITVDDIEADDIIATLWKHYEKEQKVIVSSDKDFFQLLDEKTVIHSPSAKCFINNKYVFEKFGIHARNFVVMRAIIGDKSDNLPGVRGIGIKNVLKYFPFFADEKKVQIEQVISHAKNEGEKYDRFLQNEELITNNLKVMRLDSSFIGFGSSQKIFQKLEEQISLNATAFRVRLLEDEIDSLSDSYIAPFRILEAKGKE